MQTIEAHTTSRTKKILIALLVIVGVAVIAYAIYHYFKNKAPASQPPLTVEQQQAIVKDLNAYAAENPVSDADRYQMLTGKSMPTSATTTKPVKK